MDVFKTKRERQRERQRENRRKGKAFLNSTVIDNIDTDEYVDNIKSCWNVNAAMIITKKEIIDKNGCRTGKFEYKTKTNVVKNMIDKEQNELNPRVKPRVTSKLNCFEIDKWESNDNGDFWGNRTDIKKKIV
jgi:hypothetical protein